MALATNEEAYLPVTLSLIKLHARSLWHTLKGGKNGLEFWNFDDEHGIHYFFAVIKHCSLSSPERIVATHTQELDGAKEQEPAEPMTTGDPSHATNEVPEDDGPWYLGKAKDEYKKKRGQDSTRPREDEDPVEVCFHIPSISPQLSTRFSNSGQESDAMRSRTETVTLDPMTISKVPCGVATVATRNIMTNSGRRWS